MLAQSQGLAGIDYTIVLLYMGGVLFIGTYLGKYVKSGADLFIAGKSLPFWAIGMSIVVSDIGATDFVATAGGGYRYGLTQANYDWLGSMPAMVLAAFIFIPYYWRAGCYTIPEFLGRRYNSAVQVIEAALWLAFLATMLSVMLWITAVLMRKVLDWEESKAIWITAVVVGIYTVSGGLTAVVMTDVMQMVVMFIGGAALVVLSLINADGWSGVQETVLAYGDAYKDHFHLILPHDTATPFPWTGIVLGLGIVLSTGYFVGNQAIVQRALGARSEWDAKAAMLFAAFLKLFIPLLVVLPGLSALALNPGLQNEEEAVPWMIAEVLPPGLKGLMFAAFFAALMSSVDSFLNSCSTVFVQDIYGTMAKYLWHPPTPRQSLILGRCVTIVLILAAAAFAPAIEQVEGLYSFIQTLLSYFQGPTLAILLLGILWSRTNGWGALAGLTTGVGLSFLMLNPLQEKLFMWEDPFLFVAWWTFLAAILVTVVVSLLTPPEPAEKLRGLVYGQVMHDPEVQQALQERAGE